MATLRDRILLVENDPVVSDLIGRQALQASGFNVQVVSEANSAISKALQWSPDLIITNLNLPGLSGKDLMVALTSQGIRTPVIILAQRGMEADIMQTFRVGAADYLLLPVREAEVIAAVNRALQQVHERRERERLSQQLQQTNQELQARVRELTTIFAVGKAFTSVTDRSALLDKVLDGALKVTQADLGWFLLREELDAPFVLVSERNLPNSLGVRVGQPWDDGISSLVAMSGETLSIYGDPLKRFKIAILGSSAMIVPIKAQQKRVMGLLVMMRRQGVSFSQSEQHLLEALADYASISLVNARLFKTLEERARTMQQMADAVAVGDKINIDILEGVKKALSSATESSLASLEKLGKDPTARWRPDQRQLLVNIQEQLHTLSLMSGSITPQELSQQSKDGASSPLHELVRQSIQRMQPYAQLCGITISPDLGGEAMILRIDSSLMNHVLDGLISSLIRSSGPGAVISFRLAKDKESEVGHIMVRDTKMILDPKDFEQLFEAGREVSGNQRFGGVSIRPSLVRTIVAAEHGKIWAESQPGKEFILHCALPLVK